MKTFLENNSELRLIKGDLTKLGLQTFSKGKLIVKDGCNVMIPSQARKCILKELHSTHLNPKMMKNIPGDPIKTIPLFGISGS